MGTPREGNPLPGNEAGSLTSETSRKTDYSVEPKREKEGPEGRERKEKVHPMGGPIRNQFLPDSKNKEFQKGRRGKKKTRKKERGKRREVRENPLEKRRGLCGVSCFCIVVA